MTLRKVDELKWDSGVGRALLTTRLRDRAREIIREKVRDEVSRQEHAARAAKEVHSWPRWKKEFAEDVYSLKKGELDD